MMMNYWFENDSEASFERLADTLQGNMNMDQEQTKKNRMLIL